MPEGSLASPPSSSPWNHPPPSPVDPWFLHSSHRDSQILTHALSRELGSSSRHVEQSSASSPDSLAQSLSHCISRRDPLPDHNPAAVLRALQQTVGAGVFLQQQRQPNLSSNTASPMSSSDFVSQPGSPFNSSCANSNNSLGDTVGCKPQLSMDARELECEGTNKSILGSFGLGASPVKLEESFGGKGLASSSVPSSRPSAALSAQAGVGATTTKVGKRRSRATSKPPITVLSADTSNFRAMVQKLTGIPASPTLQHNRFQLWSTPSGTVSLMKPNPTRPNQSIQGLPTLDTSAYLLLDGGSTLTQTPRFLQNENFLQSLPFLQSSQSQHDASFNTNLVGELGWNRGGGQLNQASFPSVTNPDLKSLLPNLLDPFKLGNPNNPNASCISMPMLWDGQNNDKLRERCYSDKFRDDCFTERLEEGFNGRGDNSFDKNSRQVLPQGMIGGGVEAEQFNTRPGANLESLLMGSDFDFAGRTLHTVDSWLSYDGGLGIHTPKMELAHSA